MNENYICERCHEEGSLKLTEVVHDERGTMRVCLRCYMDDYMECRHCREIWRGDLLTDQLCPECAHTL